MKYPVLPYLWILITALQMGCEKAGNTTEEPKYFTVSPCSNATIVNSSPREIHDYFESSAGEELRIGWDMQGHSMRTFLNFRIKAISPEINQELVIEKATLRVFESGTHNDPFMEQGRREVLVSLVEYTQLDTSLFNIPVIALCGPIASETKGAQTDYSLDVTEAVKNYFNCSRYECDYIRFRLHFSGDVDASATEEGPQATYWSVYAMESETDYISQLEITYSYIDY